MSDIVDSTLSNRSSNQIMRCIHIGLLCVQENVADRPTMATIALMLSSDSLSLPIPSEPAFFMNSRILFETHDLRLVRSSESQNVSAQESVNKASITEPGPR